MFHTTLWLLFYDHFSLRSCISSLLHKKKKTLNKINIYIKYTYYSLICHLLVTFLTYLRDKQNSMCVKGLKRFIEHKLVWTHWYYWWKMVFTKYTLSTIHTLCTPPNTSMIFLCNNIPTHPPTFFQNNVFVSIIREKTLCAVNKRYADLRYGATLFRYYTSA